MERSMNACDLPPAAETVVAVTRAVTLDEESRDVRAGAALLDQLTIHAACSVK